MSVPHLFFQVTVGVEGGNSKEDKKDLMINTKKFSNDNCISLAVIGCVSRDVAKSWPIICERKTAGSGVVKVFHVE